MWWDTSLVPGDVFKDVIEEKIAASKAAIVIWTKASIKSKWVYSEATRADAQGKLVPLRTADIASADIPMPFGATHAEIVDNRGGVVTALERLGVRPAPKPAPPPVLTPEALPTDADEQRRGGGGRMKAEEEHWDLIKRSRDAAALRAFVAHYPDGTFAATARARLAQVEGAGGNRTGLIRGVAAAIALAVVGAGAWSALQPARMPPELTKPTEEALLHAQAIKQADDDLLKRQRAEADAKARAQAEAEATRITKERADAEAALKQAHEAAAVATRQAAEAEKARKQAEDQARSLAKERDMAVARRKVEAEAARIAKERAEAEARRKAELEAAKPAPVHECDRLAASPYRRPKLTDGVAFSLIRPEAVSICDRAVREFPKEIRFWQQLGRSLHNAGNFIDAREWYEKAAAAGDATGMASLGVLYVEGEGVKQDYSKAREWYERAAATGNGSGMAGLGLLYSEGKGVKQDYVRALEWYEKAAAIGNSEAMVSLGLLHAEGTGVK